MAGTIRKRGNSWQALLSFTDPTTKKLVQYSKTAPTKAGAERLLAELIIKRDQNKLVRNQETMLQLAERWLENCRTSGECAPGTLVHYARYVDPGERMMKALGATKCRDLTTDHIDRYLASLSHLGTHTKRSERAALSGICALGVRYGWMEQNPVLGATKFRRPDTTVHLPDPEQFAGLLRAADADGLLAATLIRLATASGCRHGELAGLQWGDVEWDSMRVHIVRQVAGGKGVQGPKGSKADSLKDRWVALGADVLAQLKLWREEQAVAWSEVYGKVLGDADWVFAARPHSTPSSVYRRIDHRWQLVRAAAGLPTMRLHDCRHFTATALLKHYSPHVVAKRLGHSDPAVTLRVYAHVVKGDDEASGETMDAIMRGE